MKICGYLWTFCLERNLVTVHDAALRGLVGIGRVVGPAAATRVGAAIVLRVPRVRRATTSFGGV